jgi:beta-lactamase class A
VEYIYLFLLSIIIFIGAIYYQRLIKSRKKSIVKIIPLIILILIPAWFILNPKDNPEGKNILNPIGEFVEKNVQTEKKPSKELENIIQDGLSNSDGVYAIAIKNLKTNEYYYYNEDRKFDTASLYKLWVMGAVFEEIENGNLSKDENIGFEASTINEKLDIASESAEITEGFVGNTVEGALNRMITISDNYSAHILYLTIGWSKVGDFLEEYGLINSSTDSMTTTANDILSYFEKLYNGEIVNRFSSDEMIEILKKQELNDRIPKYLPENVEVAHKTGELGAVKHNSGIVYSPNGDYIIVLLSETNSQTTAAEIEAKISERVWEYFNK